MAIGLKCGLCQCDMQTRKNLVSSQTNELISGFNREFGTLLCKHLQHCDLSTVEGWKRYQETKEGELVCMKYVKYAASVVDSTPKSES